MAAGRRRSGAFNQTNLKFEIFRSQLEAWNDEAEVQMALNGEGGNFLRFGPG
jgi:hypothetical protein